MTSRRCDGYACSLVSPREGHVNNTGIAGAFESCTIWANRNRVVKSIVKAMNENKDFASASLLCDGVDGGDKAPLVGEIRVRRYSGCLECDVIVTVRSCGHVDISNKSSPDFSEARSSDFCGTTRIRHTSQRSGEPCARRSRDVSRAASALRLEPVLFPQPVLAQRPLLVQEPWLVPQRFPPVGPAANHSRQTERMDRRHKPWLRPVKLPPREEAFASWVPRSGSRF
jgi:hypothetical protein